MGETAALTVKAGWMDPTVRLTPLVWCLVLGRAATGANLLMIVISATEITVPGARVACGNPALVHPGFDCSDLPLWGFTPCPPGRSARDATLLSRVWLSMWSWCRSTIFGLKTNPTAGCRYTLAFVVVVCFHLAANLFNTYYDYVSGTDTKDTADDRALVDSTVSKKFVWRAGMGTLICGVTAAIALSLLQGTTHPNAQ